MYVSTSVMNVGLILVRLTYIHLPLSAYFGLFTIHLRFYICLCLYAPFLVSTHSKACMFTYMLHVFVNIQHVTCVCKQTSHTTCVQIKCTTSATNLRRSRGNAYAATNWTQIQIQAVGDLNTISIDCGINYYHDHYFDHDCNHRFYHE